MPNNNDDGELGLKNNGPDVIQLNAAAIRRLNELKHEDPELTGETLPGNVEDWLDVLETESGLPRETLRDGLNWEMKQMASKLITLRLNGELETHLLEEVERMKVEQPYHKVTVSMAIRSLIFEGLKAKAKQRTTKTKG